MELYDYNVASFKLHGMSDDPKYKGMISALSSAILRSLNVFAQIAMRFGLLNLKNELIKNRDIFMQSEAYVK